MHHCDTHIIAASPVPRVPWSHHHLCLTWFTHFILVSKAANVQWKHHILHNGDIKDSAVCRRSDVECILFCIEQFPAAVPG
jgi:hypothetical protein